LVDFDIVDNGIDSVFIVDVGVGSVYRVVEERGFRGEYNVGRGG